MSVRAVGIALLGVTACSQPVPPSVSVSVEPVIDFGRVPEGMTKTLPVTLQNIGTVSVDVTAFEREGADAAFAAAFAPVTLVPGASVEVPITFDGTPGAHEAGFIARYTGGEARTRVLAVTLNIDCTPITSLDFGAVMVGDTGRQTVTLHNDSAAPSHVAVGPIAAGAFSTEDSGEYTLAPGGTKTIEVRFQPAEAKAYSASLSLTAGELCPELQVTLGGRGVEALVTCPSLDFGYVNPGASLTRPLAISNAGLAPVRITPSPGASDFSVPGDELTIPGRGTVMLPVTFTPQTLGRRPGSVMLTTSAGAQPAVSCPVVGRGGGPDIEIAPRVLDFGDVPYIAGQPYGISRPVVISNVGFPTVPADPLANLHVARVTIVPKNADSPASALCFGAFDFAAGACPQAFPASYDPVVGIAANRLADLVVTFTVLPAAAGKTMEWDVTFSSDDLDEPEVTIAVKARSIALPPCQYTVTPATLDFGPLPQQVRERIVSIHNDGTAPDATCLVDHVALSPGSDPLYSLLQAPSGPTMLPPGATLDVVVRASPRVALPAAAGAVELAISSPSAPVKRVPLSASVVPSCIAFNPAAATFGTVRQGCGGPTRTIAMYGLCTSTTTVRSWSVKGAEFALVGPVAFSMGTALPMVSMPLPVELTYRPTNAGPDLGTFELTVDQDGQQVLYELPLKGQGDAAGANSESFVTPFAWKTDVLFVLDNSGSMFDDQARLAANIGTFLPPASSGIDYQVGVTLGDPSSAAAGDLLPSPRIITPALASPASLLAAKMMVPVNGAQSSPAWGALSALTPPRAFGVNSGFLRRDAALAIIAITDGADTLSWSPGAVAAVLEALKPRGQVTYSVLGAFLPAAPAGCTYNGNTDRRMHDALTARFEGIEEEICSNDWPGAMARLAASAFQRPVDPYLDGDPEPATLAVQLNGVGAPATAWTYDSAKNAVRLAFPYRPGPGDAVTVTYTSVCH